MEDADWITLFLPYGEADERAHNAKDYVTVGRFGRPGCAYIVKQQSPGAEGVTAVLMSGRKLEPGETFPSLDLDGVRRIG